MHKKTIAIKQEIQKLQSYENRVEYLHDKYRGEDCVLLTCGPSLLEYSQDFLDEYLKDKLVLSVKAAYLRHSEVTDFHFFNCCNLPHPNEQGVHYSHTPNTIPVASSNFQEGAIISSNQMYDIFFKIPCVDVRTQLNAFVSINKDFDSALLSNSFTRPVGPGIMYETVMFMAVHLGVKKITTLGWDLSQKSISSTNDYDHFYAKERSFFRPGTMMDWEIDTTRDASKDLYYWLSDKGIELNIASENSSLYENIPRVEL